MSAAERPSAAGEADAADQDTAENAEEEAEPDPLALAKDVVQFASDKSGADILLMDIRKLSIIADYFVICSGDNDRQIRAIVRGIKDGIDEQFRLDPMNRTNQAQETSGWVVLDYG
ncbi:MAG: RsfS/YbeB/iojap family protein, partial [Chloroflexota bacterium]|nr:RsfS/YbeB/iojap family protein [Chloroflexota bacterium]